MDAEEFVVDDGRKRKVVEEVHHRVIDLLIVLGKTFVEKMVHSVLKLKKVDTVSEALCIN